MNSPTPNPLEGKIEYEYTRAMNWYKKNQVEKKTWTEARSDRDLIHAPKEDNYFEQYA